MEIERPEWIGQMEGILETLNEGVMIVDDCAHILYVNDIFQQMAGAPAAEIVGSTPAHFYSGAALEKINEQRDIGLRVGGARFELFVPCKDGTRVPVVISVRTLEDPDGREFAVLTFTNITEQKRVEEELKSANARLEKHAQEIEAELQLASRVQQTLAPQALRWGNVSVEAAYQPVRTIGGDFGLVMPTGAGSLNVLVCDVSGHGISSALMANRIYTETLSLLDRGVEVDALLQRLNDFVVNQIRVSGFFFTMAVGRVDEEARRLQYASGGHPPALWVTPAGEVRRLESLATVLGLLENAVPKQAVVEVPLERGERVIFYTDGLLEVWNHRGEELGIQGFEEIVRKAAGIALGDFNQKILAQVAAWRHGPPTDDVSLVVLEKN